MKKITTLELFEDDADYFRKLKVGLKIKKMPELMNLITLYIKEAIKEGGLVIKK